MFFIRYQIKIFVLFNVQIGICIDDFKVPIIIKEFQRTFLHFVWLLRLVYWWVVVTVTDISVIYVMAHKCAGDLKKKVDLRLGSQIHRHFVWSLIIYIYIYRLIFCSYFISLSIWNRDISIWNRDISIWNRDISIKIRDICIWNRDISIC